MIVRFQSNYKHVESSSLNTFPSEKTVVEDSAPTLISYKAHKKFIHQSHLQCFPINDNQTLI